MSCIGRKDWVPALAGPAQEQSKPVRAAFCELMDEVCARHLVTPEEMLGRRRTADVVAARRDLVVKARAVGMSYPAIGVALGRDHSTIIEYATQRKTRKYREGAK